MDVERVFGIIILALEAVAAAIIVLGGFVSIAQAIQRRSFAAARFTFSNALIYALDFTIGADLLKVAFAADLRSVLVVGLVVAVRIALTLVIVWELRHLDKIDASPRKSTSSKD